MKKSFFSIHCSLLCLLLVVNGCASSPSVTITYHQVGACNGYQGPNGVVSAGTNQAYVVFGIENIDNSKRNASFTFDPNRVFVNGPPRYFFDSMLAFYKDIFGPFAAVTTTAAAGQNYGFNPSALGALVVQTVNPDGAVEANNTAYFLLYNAQSSDPPMAMVKSNSSRTTYPLTKDCHDITLK